MIDGDGVLVDGCIPDFGPPSFFKSVLVHLLTTTFASHYPFTRLASDNTSPCSYRPFGMSAEIAALCRPVHPPHRSSLKLARAVIRTCVLSIGVRGEMQGAQPMVEGPFTSLATHSSGEQLLLLALLGRASVAAVKCCGRVFAGAVPDPYY